MWANPKHGQFIITKHYNYESHSQLRHTIILAGYITTRQPLYFNPPSNSVAVNHCAQAAVAQLWSESTSRGVGSFQVCYWHPGIRTPQIWLYSRTIKFSFRYRHYCRRSWWHLLSWCLEINGNWPIVRKFKFRITQPGQQPGVNEGLNKSSSTAYNTEL